MIGRRRAYAAQHIAAFLVVLFLTHLVGIVPTAHAGDEAIGTYGAPFLHVPVGATLMCVPDVVAAMQPDASLAFSNPAVLADISNGELFLSRANWLDDLSLNAASVVLPNRRTGLRWSLGTRLLYSGGLQGYDNTGRVVEEQSYYGMAFTTGLSKKFEGVGLSLGVAVSYLREHLPLETGDGYSVTLGASYQRGANRFDAFAADLGGKLSFEGRDYPVDSHYVLGYARRISRGGDKLDLGGQITLARSDIRLLQVGAVYSFQKYFSLRAGVDHAFGAPTSATVPINGGLGARIGHFRLDYSYTPQEYFSGTHTFSLGFTFNGPAAAPAIEPTGTPMQMGAVSQSVTGRTTGTDGVTAEPRASEPQTTAYEIIAGTHATLSSAQAEVRALSLLKVRSDVRREGERFTVVIATYPTLEKANRALESYKSRGHQFVVAAKHV